MEKPKKLQPKQNLKNNNISANSLPKTLTLKLEAIKPYIDKNMDILVRNFSVFFNNKYINSSVIYMNSVTDADILNRDVLYPLMSIQNNILVSSSLHEYIHNSLLSVGNVSTTNSTNTIVESIFSGFAIIICDEIPDAFIIDIRGGAKRNINEPLIERSLFGPKEGFIEDLNTNIALIRRKLFDTQLVVEKYVVGNRSKSTVAILYIKDIAQPNIVNQTIQKIKSINIDGVISVGYISQLIEDNPHSIFPQTHETERPDVVVADLLEGRIAIIDDQSPFAIIVPSLFIEMFQSPDDYYPKYQHGAFLRIIRFIAIIISISLIPLYISLFGFHHHLIPSGIIIPIAELRSQIPFPTMVEILFLFFIVIIIFESVLRLPSELSQSIGVVAGIIVGQAIISAKLANPVAITVVALVIISSFAIPDLSMKLTFQIITIILILASSFFGLYGFSLGILIILAHLINQTSAGVPYFAPFAPTRYKDLKDALLRFPLKTLLTQRPFSIPMKKRNRQKQ